MQLLPTRNQLTQDFSFYIHTLKNWIEIIWRLRTKHLLISARNSRNMPTTLTTCVFLPSVQIAYLTPESNPKRLHRIKTSWPLWHVTLKNEKQAYKRYGFVQLALELPLRTGINLSALPFITTVSLAVLVCVWVLESAFSFR